MTLRELERMLADAGIENAAWEARCLASHCGGYSEARLLTMRDEPLDAPGLEAAALRRAAREPLQYILGEWPFMGLSFAVSPDCLIPRPDTETLVEHALAQLPLGARVADLCTGSGCIGISISHFRPDVRVTAVELYENAARAAERNARRLGVEERFTVLRGDVTKTLFPSGTVFEMVVSNPPYIAWNEMEGLAPELSFEPRAALTDEGDGLSVIRGVIRTAAEVLSPGGVLFMEMGASQGSAVLALAAQAGFTGELLRDCGGHERVLRAQKSYGQQECEV